MIPKHPEATQSPTSGSGLVHQPVSESPRGIVVLSSKSSTFTFHVANHLSNTVPSLAVQIIFPAHTWMESLCQRPISSVEQDRSGRGKHRSANPIKQQWSFWQATIPAHHQHYLTLRPLHLQLRHGTIWKRFRWKFTQMFSVELLLVFVMESPEEFNVFVVLKSNITWTLP